jgi:hypothetical protein
MDGPRRSPIVKVRFILRIAAALAADIESGRLLRGQQLPTHRGSLVAAFTQGRRSVPSSKGRRSPSGDILGANLAGSARVRSSRPRVLG